MKWLIYKHTNIINGKVYIGQTKQTSKGRWRNGLGYYNKDRSSVFWNAIIKYGWNNFTHEIIEQDILSPEIANEREIYWIDYFRSYIGFQDCNGYNMTLGGNSGEHLGYPVYQISMKDMSIIKEYPSTSEASRAISGNEGNSSHIRMCCEGQKPSCKGYYWCYKINYTKEWQPKQNQLLTPILQINDSWEVIKKFNSITECVRMTGFSQGSIVSCCMRKQAKANGYFWCYFNDYSSDWQPVDCKFKRNEKIYCFETDIVYKNAHDASVKTLTSYSGIIKACRKFSNGANGLHFCYFCDKDSYEIKITQKKGSTYSDKEIKILQDYYPRLGVCNELLEMLPTRTKGSITQMASRLGLKYTNKSKHYKRVLCVELNRVFDSIDSAYKFVGLKGGSSIGCCCSGKKKTAAGYHWKYIE